jgi:F-type H+-transporting ATPase subunit epsilon
MTELNVRLVAVDREVWSGQAKVVVAKTTEGDIGILPNHEPVLALLVDGAVSFESTDGHRRRAAVHEGFLSVEKNNVSILAETAELAEEIDIARAESAIERAKAAGADDPDEIAAIRRAETRIQVAGMTHHSH